MIDYKKATLANIDSMQTLVKSKVDDGTILPRSNEELATNIRSYTLAFDNDMLVGFCALHIHTPSLAEVRSLIIKDDYRSKGIGSNIVKLCIDEGKKLGLKEILALTYEENFFIKLGFLQIPMSSLPQSKIWADCIKCKHFPQCNEISLIKEL
jgi:amino-acid N-acetyltransferase